MKHDESCERSKGWTACHCAQRTFLDDGAWKDCLGHVPEVADSEWEDYALKILKSAH